MVGVWPVESCTWPITTVQAIVTDGIFVVLWDGYSIHTFFPSTTKNNGSEQVRYNVVCMHNSVQGQSLLRGFTLRPSALLPLQMSRHISDQVSYITMAKLRSLAAMRGLYLRMIQRLNGQQILFLRFLFARFISSWMKLKWEWSRRWMSHGGSAIHYHVLFSLTPLTARNLTLKGAFPLLLLPHYWPPSSFSG